MIYQHKFYKNHFMFNKLFFVLISNNILLNVMLTPKNSIYNIFFRKIYNIIYIILLKFIIKNIISSNQFKYFNKYKI